MLSAFHRAQQRCLSNNEDSVGSRQTSKHLFVTLYGDKRATRRSSQWELESINNFSFCIPKRDRVVCCKDTAIEDESFLQAQEEV